MAIVLDGKRVANEIKEELALKTESERRRPCLAVVLVGNDSASQIYVRNKEADCEQCGFISKEYLLDEDTSERKIVDLVSTLSFDSHVDGILVQMPLPKHIDPKRVVNAISPGKDVDCFTPHNIGLLLQGNPHFLPCTPGGIVELLKYYGICLSGKHCVIVGRSNIVGKPMTMLALQNDATVTVCHSHTRKLIDICRTADILISAVGRAEIIRPNAVREGTVVIDVGMNRNLNGKLCGDCDPDVYKKASAYTPVPGGVGPMTRAMLMLNTAKAAWV